MNFDKDPMQNTQTNQISEPKVKNTLSTSHSRGDTDIDTDQNFKSQRQKYLQQRLNRRQQIKKVRKQHFGSSSSESEDDQPKLKPQPKLNKDNQFQSQKIQSPKLSPKKNQQEDFHLKHQAYIKQKLARKQQLIQQRKKQFGSSSSQSSDDDVKSTGINKNGLKIQTPSESGKSSSKQVSSKVNQKSQSPIKKQFSIKQQTSIKQKSPQPIIQQIVYTKGQNFNEAKKLNILIQSKKNQQWIQQTLIIQNKKLKFMSLNIEFMIAYINKMKLLFTSVNKDYFKLKITHKGEDFFFAASVTKLTDNVPDYYYVFSRIIQDKLILLGFEPKKNEPSIFPNFMNLKEGPQNLKAPQCLVYGNILKKSQVFGNWQTRFIYLTQKQIGSSKKPNQKPSMVISSQSISQLWTRFDIEDNNLLNIKIMYSSTKTQFGIPLSYFTDEWNWLYSFYKIISKNKKF